MTGAGAGAGASSDVTGAVRGREKQATVGSRLAGFRDRFIHPVTEVISRVRGRKGGRRGGGKRET